MSIHPPGIRYNIYKGSPTPSSGRYMAHWTTASFAVIVLSQKEVEPIRELYPDSIRDLSHQAAEFLLRQYLNFSPKFIMSRESLKFSHSSFLDRISPRLSIYFHSQPTFSSPARLHVKLSQHGNLSQWSGLQVIF